MISTLSSIVVGHTTALPILAAAAAASVPNQGGFTSNQDFNTLYQQHFYNNASSYSYLSDFNASSALVELLGAALDEASNSSSPATNSTNSSSALEDISDGGGEFVEPQIPAYIRTTSMVFCVIIMCLGVVGNVMVPIVIMKTKDMRNSTNIFLMNLSIADLMVLLVCTPTVLVEVNTRPETWVLGKEMCLAVPFVELTVAHASVLTILAISFERYYAICEPLKAGYVCTKTRAALICFLAWFVAAVFTSPILAVAEYRFEEYHDGTQVPVCLTQAQEFWPTFYFLMTISLFFLVPFLVLLVLYTIIARNLISTASKVVMNKHVDCCNFRARRQVVMMLGAVILSFFVCLMPFKFLTLWIVIVPDETVRRLGVEKYYNILYFSRTMLYLNSAVNPVLYNLMSSKFRDGFLLVCRLRTKRQLKNHRTRERAGTFRTTSSYTTTSSTLSRRSNSLKHIFKKASLANSESGEDPNRIQSQHKQEPKRAKLDRSISSLPNLFPHKTARQNSMEAPIKQQPSSRGEDEILVDHPQDKDLKNQKEKTPFLIKQKSLDFVCHASSLRKSVLMRSASKTIELGESGELRINPQESYV